MCVHMYFEEFYTPLEPREYSLNAGDPFKYLSSSTVKYNGVLYVSGNISEGC